ncbi:MAG: DNA/RNA helicase domain-containing protein [Allobaculum sp.]
MLIYSGRKSTFMEDTDQEVLVNKLEQTLLQKMNRKTPANEIRSWQNSLLYMYRVLNDNEIPDDAGIAIEYNIPLTSKRVDFMISGMDEEDHQNIVIVELKQWEKLEAIEGDGNIVRTFINKGIHTLTHPSYQAWSYSAFIQEYNSYVEDEDVRLHPCAYLHNYQRMEQDDPLDSSQYEEVLELAPAFTRGQTRNLRSFIKERINYGDEKDTLKNIDYGKLRPSKRLQDVIASMLKGNKEFVLLDRQQVVFQIIKNLSMQSQEDHHKRTIIVKGGPGTGKTVVAINLLAELTQKGQLIQYVTKNSQVRSVYAERLKGTKKRREIDNMFKGSGSFVGTQKNEFATLLVDEAHRLVEKNRYNKDSFNQVKEIIDASYCSVFFIDESQQVTMDDIGSIAEIEKWGKKAHSEVTKLELVSQFRCNGSDGYLAWLDHTLGIRETANYDLDGIDYDFRVFDSPEEMYQAICEKNEIDHRSRLLAGYCWNWDTKHANDPDYADIRIGDFEISWNMKNKTFATDEDSIHQAGCIHTTQGLEFEYVGVIIGDDLRYENDQVITDFNKRAKTDKSLNGIKKMYKQNPQKAQAKADQLIKNTYRTLMSRGMKGCYVYCTNPELAAYLKEQAKLAEE